MIVHQMGSVLAYGDAITNHIAAIDRRLIGWGYATRIYGANIEAARLPTAQLDTAYAPYLDCPDDLLIYHYSAYCDNYRLFQRSRNRKILIYHNITPAHFFRPYDATLEGVCAQGRAVLSELTCCDLALGVSEYNRRELVDAGFAPDKTGVLPVLVDFEVIDREPRQEKLYRRLTDGRVNILFVGRMAPNKAIEDVIGVFHTYHRYVNPRARLTLAGARGWERYSRALDGLVARLGLNNAVTFTDRIPLADLKTYYQTAHLFLSASQHEGFCVPLLEAMHFDLPILARACAAVPDTLDRAGVLFHALDRPVLAETIHRLVTDGALRQQIVAGQRARLADFAPERVEGQLKQVIEQVVM